MRSTTALLASLVALVTTTHTHADPEPGWTLYSGLASRNTSLIDLDGNVVQTWSGTFSPGVSVYLVGGGSILRPANDPSLPGPSGGGVGGRIQQIAWDGTMEWDYVLGTSDLRQHHDIRLLPNGNVLAIAWEVRTRAEAIAMGRDPAGLGSEVWSEAILEIRPTGLTTGEVVWAWHAWDHLVQNFDPDLPNFGEPSDHPERIDINFTPNGTDPDWLHFNGLDFNEELDQIIMSCHAFDELWIISRAPDSDGDLLYRWGNPRAYGMGTIADQKFFNQHNTRWIAPGLPGEGNILVYNNGNGRPGGSFSSVEELVPPVNPDGTYTRASGEPFGPDAPDWICDNAGGAMFYSSFISGAQRLPNGNTLVCVGATGRFLELTPDCDIDWEFNEGGAQFRATRIGIRDRRLADLLFCAPDLAEPYGQLDLFDFLAFQNAFDAGDLAADFDDDGELTFFDLLAFQNAFSTGCP